MPGQESRLLRSFARALSDFLFIIQLFLLFSDKFVLRFFFALPFCCSFGARVSLRASRASVNSVMYGCNALFFLYCTRGKSESESSANAFFLARQRRRQNVKHKPGVKRVKVVDEHAFLVGFALSLECLATIVLKSFFHSSLWFSLKCRLLVRKN